MAASTRPPGRKRCEVSAQPLMPRTGRYRGRNRQSTHSPPAPSIEVVALALGHQGPLQKSGAADFVAGDASAAGAPKRPKSRRNLGRSMRPKLMSAVSCWLALAGLMVAAGARQLAAVRLRRVQRLRAQPMAAPSTSAAEQATAELAEA